MATGRTPSNDQPNTEQPSNEQPGNAEGSQPTVTTASAEVDPQTGSETKKEPEREGREVKLGVGTGENTPTVTADSEIADEIEGKSGDDTSDSSS